MNFILFYIPIHSLTEQSLFTFLCCVIIQTSYFGRPPYESRSPGRLHLIRTVTLPFWRSLSNFDKSPTKENIHRRKWLFISHISVFSSQLSSPSQNMLISHDFQPAFQQMDYMKPEQSQLLMANSIPPWLDRLAPAISQ